MTSAVSINNLTKAYGNLQAVRGVSFDVAPGEVFGLLGPNGAGKTTTLECIIGLRRPDSGTIRIAGIDALAQPARAKELLGAQLQFTELQSKITPRQALRLFASFYPHHEDIDGLLAQFNLTEKGDKAFETLSGGQQHRLAVALALVHQPKVVFLDEPTAGLDPLNRMELLSIIARLKDAGRAIVITTHQIEEANRLCDRVAIMRDGLITAMDTPAALIAASKVPPWVLVRTKLPLDPVRLQSIAGVTSSVLVDGRWRLETSNASQTIQDLTRLIESERNEVLELQIQHATLEDIFLDHTADPGKPSQRGIS